MEQIYGLKSCKKILVNELSIKPKEYNIFYYLDIDLSDNTKRHWYIIKTFNLTSI